MGGVTVPIRCVCPPAVPAGPQVPRRGPSAVAARPQSAEAARC
jgi:hypothetical protein